MKYLALNGFRHPLNRYFNDKVECINQFNWTSRNAIKFAQTIMEPTTLIGFSDGATAALTIANNSKYVEHVYAHSPLFRDEKVFTRARIHLFRTKGDLTPTYNQTLQVFYKYSETPVNVSIQTLKPTTHEPIRDFATFVMRIKNHQFRNCLPHLPGDLL